MESAGWERAMDSWSTLLPECFRRHKCYQTIGKLSAIGRNRIEITSKPSHSEENDNHKDLNYSGRLTFLGRTDVLRNSSDNHWPESPRQNHITKKIADIAVVMFRSALPPRASNGRIDMEISRRVGMSPTNCSDSRDQSKTSSRTG